MAFTDAHVGLFGLVPAPSAAAVRRIVGSLLPGGLEGLVRVASGSMPGAVAASGLAGDGAVPSRCCPPGRRRGMSSRSRRSQTEVVRVAGFAPLLSVLDLRGPW
ncbi:hypothetical protein [Streptomyces sp. YGL11-2]|uniref:hypothetical protein n=1 Tax=Streptomyces sp. YGL11-2 TaxID=3414028 RepID=UPI003CEE5836